MKRFIYFACLNFALMPIISMAQDQSDALRYSQNSICGTARFEAMGGAFGAVGGDLSSLAYNPAGIAVFTKNQLSISPGLTLQNTASTYGGLQNTNESQSFNIQNAGMVGTWKARKEDALWKSYNFGVSYNRMNNFNSNITIVGYNSKSSLLDAFTEAANGTYYTQLDQFQTGPAFNTWLLDTLSNTNASQYYNLIHPYLSNGSGDEIQQTESLNTIGSMGETDISFGGDYNDKLFVGASVGIVDVFYNENLSYSETPYNYTDSAFGLRNFTYNSTLSTRGEGVNFKIGFIYRIMDWLRIGGAIHTPTLLSLEDVYNTSITANFNPAPYTNYTGGSNQISSPQGVSDYTLTTPLRAIGGASVIINKQGIISADYEYVDYSSARLNSTNGSLPASVNQAIAQDYMMASNLRFGFEWVLYPVSFRAGYAIYGNPYSTSAGNSSLRTTYSAGLGLKINNVFIDLAYTLMSYNENYYLYTLSDASLVSPVLNKTNVSNIILTLGVNFDHKQNRIQRKERFRGYPPPPPPPPPPGG